MCTRSWRQALVSGTDVEANLEALTGYGLASHSQHLELLQCPGLVHAIVGQLKSPSPTTSTSTCAARQSSEQLDVAAAALEAAISLTISQQGLQTLIDAGAVDVACSLLCELCGQQTCQEPSFKRRKTAAGALEQPMDEAVQDCVVLLVRLLAALLLEASPARPAVGSLNATLAADTAVALLQVLSGRSCPELQQQSAAVMMRLSMEPGVATVLCRPAHPADAEAAQQAGKGVGDCPSLQRHPAGYCEAGALPGSSSTQSSGGLSLLLGQQVSEDQFYQAHWESEPLLCTMPQDAAHSSSAHALAELLTPAGVIDQLLPCAVHCPVLPACIDDPVQVLQELHAQGLLLQPLQPTDIRIIKAQAQNPAAAQPPSPAHGAQEHPTSTAPMRRHSQRSAHPTDEPAVASAQEFPTSTAPAHSQHSAHPTHDTVVASAGSMPQEVLLDISGGVSAPAFPAAVASGFTVVLRDMPKRCCAVAQLAEVLEGQLGLPAGANMYLTPAGAQGLQAHYDDHDVFVLQLAGSKTWLVGPPQHQPLPLTHQPRLPVVPPDLYCPDGQPPAASCMHSPAASGPFGDKAPQLTPIGQQVPGGVVAVDGQQGVQAGQSASQSSKCWPQQLMLQAGDCLYIPRGWVHQAVTPAAAAAAETDLAVPGSAVGLQQAGSTADGCSLHVSIGEDVSADASVQGFLQHLVGTCASRALAGACSSCCFSTALTPSVAAMAGEGVCEQQQLEPLAVQAAALLLQLRLWQHGRQHSVYRKACPLLASGRTAELLSSAVLTQLQRAHHEHHTAHCVGAAVPAAGVQCASTPTPGPPQPQERAAPAEPPAGDQLHQPWLDRAVQQLQCWLPYGGARGYCDSPARPAAHTAGVTAGSGPSTITAPPAAHPLVPVPGIDPSALSRPGVESCGSLKPLLQMAEQLLGCMLAAPGQSQDTGEAGGGLQELCSQLEAAVGSTCSSCGSTSCHSSLLCASAVLQQLRPAAASGGGSGRNLQDAALPPALQQHVSACMCCAALLLRDGAAPVLQSDAAVKRAVQPHATTSSSADPTARAHQQEQRAAGHSSSPAKGVAVARIVGAVEAELDLEAGASQQLHVAARQTPLALACLHRCLRCLECRTAAVTGYTARAQSELASCQAVRRGFLALAALTQQQHRLRTLQQ